MSTTARLDRRPTVPDLAPGITRLRADPGTTALHRVACAALATATGPAYWVDARNRASTRALYAAAPDRLSLERLRIARAFTAHQHHSLVCELERRAAADASLVVVPAMPALYRDDALLAGEGEALFRASVKALLRLRRRHDLPILVAHAPDADDAFADLLAACADRELTCEETRAGLRFPGGDETRGYDAGRHAQATLAGWERDPVPATRRPERRPVDAEAEATRSAAEADRRAEVEA